jgi:hypothetical protein
MHIKIEESLKSLLILTLFSIKKDFAFKIKIKTQPRHGLSSSDKNVMHFSLFFCSICRSVIHHRAILVTLFEPTLVGQLSHTFLMIYM